MNGMHDRTIGDQPWRITPSQPSRPVAIPDDAVEEGGFWYWLDGVVPDLHIMCTGGNGPPFEIQDDNAEYPDAIHQRRAWLLEQYGRNRS